MSDMPNASREDRINRLRELAAQPWPPDTPTKELIEMYGVCPYCRSAPMASRWINHGDDEFEVTICCIAQCVLEEHVEPDLAWPDNPPELALSILRKVFDEGPTSWMGGPYIAIGGDSITIDGTAADLTAEEVALLQKLQREARDLAQTEG